MTVAPVNINDTIKTVKRGPTERQRKFINHFPNKGFISRLYKEVLQLNYRNAYSVIEKKKNGQRIEIEIDIPPERIRKCPGNTRTDTKYN